MEGLMTSRVMHDERLSSKSQGHKVTFWQQKCFVT